jgi:hypothetical protein
MYGKQYMGNSSFEALDDKQIYFTKAQVIDLLKYTDIEAWSADKQYKFGAKVIFDDVVYIWLNDKLDPVSGLSPKRDWNILYKDKSSLILDTKPDKNLDITQGVRLGDIVVVKKVPEGATNPVVTGIYVNKKNAPGEAEWESIAGEDEGDDNTKRKSEVHFVESTPGASDDIDKGFKPGDFAILKRKNPNDKDRLFIISDNTKDAARWADLTPKDDIDISKYPKVYEKDTKPTKTDDNTKGYRKGDVVIAGDEVYTATDVTLNNAKWSGGEKGSSTFGGLFLPPKAGETFSKDGKDYEGIPKSINTYEVVVKDNGQIISKKEYKVNDLYVVDNNGELELYALSGSLEWIQIKSKEIADYASPWKPRTNYTDTMIFSAVVGIDDAVTHDGKKLYKDKMYLLRYKETKQSKANLTKTEFHQMEAIGSVLYKEDDSIHLMETGGVLKKNPVPFNLMKTSGVTNVELPLDAEENDWVRLVDGTGNGQTNNVVVEKGSYTIDGKSEDLILDVNHYNVTLILNGNNWIVNGGM